jgi:hypothetical protein
MDRIVDFQRRKSYVSPQITTYGDLRELTKIKGAGGKDSVSAVVKTKAASG